LAIKFIPELLFERGKLIHGFDLKKWLNPGISMLKPKGINRS
jgi:hypothetical protein